MAVNAIGSSWKTNIRTGQMPDRDYRLYLDPRGLEYPDLGTGSASYTVAREDNLIDRGNCELGIAPMVAGETVPELSGATFAMSTDFSHTGDSSYKVTKSNAAGNAAQVYLIDDSASTTDMHGFVSGSEYTFGVWFYIPTASGIDTSEVQLRFQEYTISGASWSNLGDETPLTLDEWNYVSISGTLSDDASAVRMFFRMPSTVALNEYFYVDDIKLTTHNIPGSHYLSSGYTEHLLAMPDKFTMQIKFKPNFAYDTATYYRLGGWYVSATQYCHLLYNPTADNFYITYRDGGATSQLFSSTYDDGTTYRNINQYLIWTIAFDSTTGDTSGSALWMNKTRDDTVWSAAVTPKVTEFNKIRWGGSDGSNDMPCDIAYVRFFSDYVATDADVQNDFKDVKAEEIYFSLDGHGTGRSRVNVSEFMVGNSSYRGVGAKLAASQGTNTFDFRLKNLFGEFSDDQNAVFDPANSVYNGTDEQNYLQRRFGVIYETWYDGDYDTLFNGRVTEQGLTRQSLNENISYVTGSAEDGIGDIDRSIERYGRVYEDLMMVRSNTLIDRGSCESSTPPAMFGETTNTLSNATFARSTGQIFKGRYAYLATKTIAAGTASSIALTDNTSAGDMHGMLAGETYTLKAKVYIPTGMLGSELSLEIIDSAGLTQTFATNVYDSWQEISVTRTIDAGATYAYVKFQIASAAADTETFYVDDIRLIPTNLNEATSRSLFHKLAHRSDRKQIQYLANNSFENTTIGNSWGSSGGVLSRVAGGLFGTYAGQHVNASGSTRVMRQTVDFTGSKKLNIGETYNVSIWLSSAVAASEDIDLIERDGSSDLATSSVTYSLIGGEGWVKYEISHTIENATAEQLRLSISIENGETILYDGAMLIQADRALDYFEVNSTDGASGIVSADVAVEASWPWFGINAGNADYIHPWRRQERGTSDWLNLKSIANGLASKYIGMDECGTLTLQAMLDKDYAEPVIADLLDGDEDFRQDIQVNLDDVMGNKFVGTGDRYEKGQYDRLIWLASGAGNFEGAEGDQQISEAVIDDAYWPDPDAYPEYWATYGDAGSESVGEKLTLAPGFEIISVPVGHSGQSVRRRVRAEKLLNKTTVSKSDNIIGIKDADLIHKLQDTGDGLGGFTEVTSGTLVNGLDITSRAGQARILLRNEMGGTKTVMDAGILGKPVFKFTGREGYIHDAFVDYDSISKDGEQVIEFGGEDVIDGSANGQLDRLADYFWKDRRERKHIYSISFVGTPFDIVPAAWYRLQAGAVGTAENIDSTVEVMSVRTEHNAGQLGRTIVTFREVQEAWKPDSNALSRFIARGVPISKPSTGAVVTVGSEYYMGTTDYRIPIGETSAEDYINSAIDYLSGTFGGGTVRLTEGTYKVDGSIILKSNVGVTGSGTSTIIESSIGRAFDITGTVSDKDDWSINDLKVTRTDSNNVPSIDMQDVDNWVISGVTIVGAIQDGIQITNSKNGTIRGCNIDGSDVARAGIYNSGGLTVGGIVIEDCDISQSDIGIFTGDPQIRISNCFIHDLINGTGDTIGIHIYSSDDSLVTNCHLKDIDQTDNSYYSYGIQIEPTVSGARIGGCTIDDVDHSGTAAQAYGVYIEGDDCGFSNSIVKSGSGTSVVLPSGADNNQVTGNRFINNGTNTPSDSGAGNTLANNDAT